MKKFLLVGLAVMLLAGMSFSSVLAQYTTVTSFQVQNLSSQTANVQLMYYDNNGNVVTGATVSDTIAANSNKLYVQSGNSALAPGFNGSVVVASDQPVAAIGVQEASNGTLKYQGTYGGFSAADSATKFYLPVAMKAYYNYTTEISVQNASTSDVSVSISYSGNYTDTFSPLKPGQVHRFNNANTPNMPDKYIGSAVVNATGNVVAVVNQNAVAGSTPQQQTYEGFSVANSGTTLYVPVLMKTYYGFNTSLQVQNVGDTSTNITVTLSNGQIRTAALAPGAGQLFVQSGDTGLPNKWLGSAVVTSSGANVVAIVNQQNLLTGKAASYNAFARAGTHYVGPNVMRTYYGFNTSVQVQNVGTITATCSARFQGTAKNSIGQVIPIDTTDNSSAIGPNGTYLYVQQNQTDLGASSFVGAVDITCQGQPFVMMVNQNGADGQGDNAMAYDGIPVQ